MTRLRAQPIRVVLRFVASVMMVSGILLISRRGGHPGLAGAGLRLLLGAPAGQAREGPDRPAGAGRAQAAAARRRASGRSLIPSIGVSEYVVEGTDADNLRKGPGHYPDTPLPGQQGTSAIAGHRTTYGAPVPQAQRARAQATGSSSSCPTARSSTGSTRPRSSTTARSGSRGRSATPSWCSPRAIRFTPRRSASWRSPGSPSGARRRCGRPRRRAAGPTDRPPPWRRPATRTTS